MAEAEPVDDHGGVAAFLPGLGEAVRADYAQVGAPLLDLERNVGVALEVHRDAGERRNLRDVAARVRPGHSHPACTQEEQRRLVQGSVTRNRNA